MLAYDALFFRFKFRFILEMSQICAYDSIELHVPADARHSQAIYMSGNSFEPQGGYMKLA